MNLPPFNGDFHEWESFRDRFQSLIIDNKGLSDYMRMHFLSSCLTGRARDAISDVSITADSFSDAWQALISRFENKTLLIENHIGRLANLNAVAREVARELYLLRDTVNRAASSLRRLDRSSDDLASDFMVYHVVRKLDPSTRRA